MKFTVIGAMIMAIAIAGALTLSPTKDAQASVDNQRINCELAFADSSSSGVYATIADVPGCEQFGESAEVEAQAAQVLHRGTAEHSLATCMAAARIHWARAGYSSRSYGDVPVYYSSGARRVASADGTTGTDLEQRLRLAREIATSDRCEDLYSTRRPAS